MLAKLSVLWVINTKLEEEGIEEVSVWRDLQ